MGTKKNVDSVANAKENTSEDMDATDLADELQTLSDMLPKEMNTCLLVLQHIFSEKTAHVFPNVTVAIRIFLRMPVSAASAERSFYKLKPIKSYLSSTVNQKRLNWLTQIAIEKEISRSLDIQELVATFAAQKTRKRKI
jgi:hypothetical protein